MDGIGKPALSDAGARSLMRSAHVPGRSDNPMGALRAQLGSGPFALVVLFASPEADFLALMAAAERAFPDTPTAGCTTAGEITAEGYTEGEIVAVALPAAHFSARTLVVEDLSRIDPQALVGDMIRTRAALGRDVPDFAHEFAMLMVDGLSVQEDALCSALLGGLGPVPLFGGSAGDGTRFRQTFVGHGGQTLGNAAVLCFVRTDCPVRVFSLDHLHPSDRRMVVTEADPKNRIVRKINAEPAAREYARLLGKDPEQLSPLTFAAHPVVVRIGGRHHVRAIQRVADNGDLVFFAAIDEGLVLTLADPEDMAVHLERSLSELGATETPAAILACDCVLRRIEAQEKQKMTELSRLLARHNVVGFSTYGEQVGGLHVNQTMTGVAIYPPLTRTGT
ncbi:hypothetical protein RGUI_2635 [Rhodovulum sp. P5]|uniref:FIST N-terminal domain-containing protein n=1 Tax=Rhodovulum sp. P5 TaxID=1564506 RepID=UPI0009C2357E|nr:FIST N-terminal domain-containing protein [Rhodovulum sp. P5]ARE40776.1 hypothetical protein RGUI_2635 [Rhodovulum sp. P5]